MSDVVDEHSISFRRLPLLLSVAEGMLEVSTLHWDRVQNRKRVAGVPTKQSQSLVNGILEQQHFVKTATLYCDQLRENFSKSQKLGQIKKLETCLKHLSDVHTQLLGNL